jgi:hypothetical protein
MDVSKAKLSRSFLLRRVERYRDQHPNPRGSCSWADLNLGSSSVPLREGVDNPSVSLVGLSFSYLCQSLFLNIRMFLHRVSSVLTAPRGGGGSPYLRMWRGRRSTVSTTNGCEHGGKGGRIGALPRRRQESRGRTLPPSLNPREGTMKRRIKMESRGK